MIRTAVTDTPTDTGTTRTTTVMPTATIHTYPITRNPDRLSSALRGPASVKLRLLARKSWLRSDPSDYLGLGPTD
jgi:hypothetical protein